MDLATCKEHYNCIVVFYDLECPLCRATEDVDRAEDNAESEMDELRDEIISLKTQIKEEKAAHE